MANDGDFFLVLREVAYHPNSYLTKMLQKFETPSVIRVTKKEELKRYKAPPLFNEKYLVIFETVATLQDNYTFVNFNIMFPVFVAETKSQFDDVLFFLNSVKCAYRVYNNAFTKEDAMAFVASKAKEPVSESFCKAVVRHVGLSPLRIMTAISVCDQMGYTIKNVERYVDKYTYVDRRRLIETLLGVPKSKSAVRSSFLYLQLNRHWYRYVRDDLVDELNVIIDIYRDKIDGVLRRENLFAYLEERSKKVTRAQVVYALNLFDRVSLVNVVALREFIKTAGLLEVVLQMM